MKIIEALEKIEEIEKSIELPHDTWRLDQKSRIFLEKMKLIEKIQLKYPHLSHAEIIKHISNTKRSSNSEHQVISFLDRQLSSR